MRPPNDQPSGKASSHALASSARISVILPAFLTFKRPSLISSNTFVVDFRRELTRD
jgi:hypothetical protein